MKQTKKVSDSKPQPRNPRTISDEQIEALKLSLGEFGDLSGFVHNERTGNTVGGHQRGKIFADAKIVIEKTYPKPTKTGTIAEGYIEYEGERFVYRAVRWSKTKEAAAMIAANKHGGEWDWPLLKEILSELDTGEFDMSLTGFSESELEELMTAAPPEENPNTGIIPSVTYEMTREDKPALTELYDNAKEMDLIAKIKAKNLPKDETNFLIAAARRHTIFNFENIAEYYAHSLPDVQELMEQSALVIVDFNKAIEYGFAAFTEEIKDLIGQEDKSGDET